MAVLKYRDPTTQAWVIIPQLQGPAGPIGSVSTVVGPAGPAGYPGPTGPAGTTGTAGPDGATGTASHAEITAEPPATPAVGDMWIDSDDKVMTWDTAWQFPVMENGWVNYGDVYGVPRYRKLIDGMVTIQGLIMNGTNAMPAFTLPVGYRPRTTLIFSTISNPNTGVRFDVYNDGGVIPRIFGAGTNSFLSVCCTFHAEQ